jgi:putative ABC transport system substrate-binding protein
VAGQSTWVPESPGGNCAALASPALIQNNSGLPQGLAGRRPDAIFVLDDASFIATRAGMAAAAARHRLPLICAFREMAEAGCLFSYSVSLKDTWYRSASFVDKILKGSSPSDLPVQQATKFELVINFKTARALGLDISPILLARADEVIE